MLPSPDAPTAAHMNQLRQLLEKMKWASQLEAADLEPNTLPLSLHALYELDRALNTFETILNVAVCPLLSTAQVQVSGKEAVAWCAMMANIPKEKTVKSQLKNLTDQQKDTAAKKAGTHGSFIAAVLALGYVDQATITQIKLKLGEGANHELKKKWQQYKDWDYSNVESQLKAVPPARNALNHNQPLDVATVVDTVRGKGQILNELALDGSALEVSSIGVFESVDWLSGAAH